MVDVQERKRRNNILRILSEKKRAKFYSDMIGTKQDVMFENVNKNGLMHGFSSNYVKVQTDFNESLTGQICPIMLTEANTEICSGTIISTKKSIDLVIT